MKSPQASISSTSFRVRRPSHDSPWSEARAREVLAGWDPGRQTLGEYARTLGVRTSRLTYWVAKFEAERAPAPMGFLPVVVKPSLAPCTARPTAPSQTSRQDFEIVLSAGRRVMVPADFEPGALMRLVRALEAVPSC
jgi:hypothetical protein